MRLKLKQISQAGIFTIIGYLLSPLSWWNDFFINLPISLGLATLISKIHSSLFTSASIFFYWLTNLTGLILFHKGIEKMITQEKKLGFHSSKTFNIIISIIYSIFILILIKLNILKPLF